MSKTSLPKFRTNYDPDFKSVVVKYAIQTSNKAASDRFGINESNVRRWKRLSIREREDLYENPLARRPVTSKKVGRRRRNSGRSRRKRRKSATYLQENSSDIAVNCSKRWAYIRDYYIRRRGKPGIGSSGEAAKKRSNLLLFLDNYSSIKRSTISNVSNMYEITEEVVENDNASLGQNQNGEFWEATENIKEEAPELESEVQKVKTPQIQKKRKIVSHSEERLQLVKQIVDCQSSSIEGEDETDLFFSSMAKIVKKLPPRDRTRIRMEISTIVGNAELKYLADMESSCPSSSASVNFSNYIYSPALFSESEDHVDNACSLP